MSSKLKKLARIRQANSGEPYTEARRKVLQALADHDHVIADDNLRLRTSKGQSLSVHDALAVGALASHAHDDLATWEAAWRTEYLPAALSNWATDTLFDGESPYVLHIFDGDVALDQMATLETLAVLFVQKLLDLLDDDAYLEEAVERVAGMYGFYAEVAGVRPDIRDGLAEIVTVTGEEVLETLQQLDLRGGVRDWIANRDVFDTVLCTKAAAAAIAAHPGAVDQSAYEALTVLVAGTAHVVASTAALAAPERAARCAEVAAWATLASPRLAWEMIETNFANGQWVDPALGESFAVVWDHLCETLDAGPRSAATGLMIAAALDPRYRPLPSALPEVVGSADGIALLQHVAAVSTDEGARDAALRLAAPARGWSEADDLDWAFPERTDLAADLDRPASLTAAQLRRLEAADSPAVRLYAAMHPAASTASRRRILAGFDDANDAVFAAGRLPWPVTAAQFADWQRAGLVWPEMLSSVEPLPDAVLLAAVADLSAHGVMLWVCDVPYELGRGLGGENGGVWEQPHPNAPTPARILGLWPMLPWFTSRSLGFDEALVAALGEPRGSAAGNVPVGVARNSEPYSGFPLVAALAWAQLDAAGAGHRFGEALSLLPSWEGTVGQLVATLTAPAAEQPEQPEQPDDQTEQAPQHRAELS